MIDEKGPLVDLFGSREEHDAWLKRFHALNEARHSHPYVADLIRVLLPFSNGLRRSMIIHELKKTEKERRVTDSAFIRRIGSEQLQPALHRLIGFSDAEGAG